MHRNIISTVKPSRCTSVSNLFILEWHCMFRVVFPSIIRSSRLYIQQPNRYCCLLASKQTAVSEKTSQGSSIRKTSQYRMNDGHSTEWRMGCTRGSQIFQKSRSYLHILGDRKATCSNFHTEVQKFSVTFEPHCYLALSVLCTWTNTRLCATGRGWGRLQ